MNIHVRVIGRLFKIMLVPALVGVSIALIFEYLPMQYILSALAIVLAVFMFWLFYNWTLDQIKHEDQLREMKELMKNDQASR